MFLDSMFTFDSWYGMLFNVYYYVFFVKALVLLKQVSQAVSILLIGHQECHRRVCLIFPTSLV